MIRAVLAFIVLGIAAQAGLARDSSWQIKGSPTQPPFVLLIALGAKAEERGYFFDCSEKARVKITQTGVTELQAGQPPLMALSVDNSPPNLVLASSVPNPAGGVDLTISIEKTDKAFVGLPKGKMVVLFSTGHTIAVTLDDKDRTVIGGFVQQCVDAG